MLRKMQSRAVSTFRARYGSRALLTVTQVLGQIAKRFSETYFGANEIDADLMMLLHHPFEFLVYGGGQSSRFMFGFHNAYAHSASPKARKAPPLCPQQRANVVKLFCIRIVSNVYQT